MKREEIDANPVLKLSFEFSLEVIKFCNSLEANKKFVVANQLLKAGTSIGANVFEAQNPESRADFIHKFKVAAKEASETEYWLLLCNVAEGYPEPGHLMKKLESLIKLIGKIISGSKR